MQTPIPELVAPAGTADKLRSALHFGADAVYLGLKRYSMRRFAGNFSAEELEWALGYAHEQGRRVYVTINIQPFDEDLDGIAQTLRTLAQLKPDGVVVADPGVIDLARREAPELPLHLSTQASVTNSGAARFWLGQGIRRIVVARELHLDQLTRLCANAPGRIEAFAHGAVCIAYSGRCLLSLYWAGRDPRVGACAQGCRWQYKELVDSRHPEAQQRVEQDERGTYFFDAKDLCALPVLHRLVDTGVAALKLEGRTRSAYYVGVAVDVYRRALDQLAEGDLDGFLAARDAYVAELQRGSKRPFSSHFLTGEQDRIESYLPEGGRPDGRSEFVGKVVASDGESVVVGVRNPVRPGDRLELRDRGLRCEEVVAEPLVSRDGDRLELARTGSEIRLAGRFRASPGALVRQAR